MRMGQFWHFFNLRDSKRVTCGLGDQQETKGVEPGEGRGSG